MFNTEYKKINCLFDENSFLEITYNRGHDTTIITKYENPNACDFDFGEEFRIHHPDGSSLYEKIYGLLNDTDDKIKNDEAKIILEPNNTKLNLFKWQKTEILDEADKSILSIYKSEQGFIGVQTAHLNSEFAVGPIVWLSGPGGYTKENKMLEKRNDIFAPLFDHVKELEKTFPVPKVLG